VGTSTFPLNTIFGDTEVLFNGQPSPIYYVGPSQINFVVPNGQNPGDIPTSGNADIQVLRASTGQILADGSVPMSPAAPGILQAISAGQFRQAVVMNQDGTPNSSTNQATRGSVIQIFAAGSGFIPGAPPDGVSAQSQVSTPNIPDVIIGACRVDDSACTMESGEHVKYSGVSSYPGVWQINVQIPMNTAPATQAPLLIGMNGIYSSDNNALKNDGFVMVIAVK
jgi:uncharacterized protein (TIGR03437 family)